MLQGVPLIATSPVRHEPPITILPTPVEVHKFPGGPWPIDLVVPPPGNIDSDLDAAALPLVNGGVADSPVPSPAGLGEMAVGALVLPPGVRPDSGRRCGSASALGGRCVARSSRPSAVYRGLVRR
jgi:hypothetical protein